MFPRRSNLTPSSDVPVAVTSRENGPRRRLIQSLGFDRVAGVAVSDPVVPPDVSVVIDPELGEGIAQMWVEGGLDPKIERTRYGERRPTLVDRFIDIPWAWVTSGNADPKDTNAVDRGIPRAGSWNPGLEFPAEIGLLVYDFHAQPDSAGKRAINAEVTDFVNNWRLFAPVVNVVPYWAVRPEVTSWAPYTGNLPYFNSPHTISLK